MSTHGPFTPPQQEEPVNDKIMETWRAFFKMNALSVPQEKLSLYAMGKLTQIALVNYLRFREIYPKELFVKRRCNQLVYYTFKTDSDHGGNLNEIVRSVGTFINVTALKALRFQLFTNPDRPNEIGEELHFKFFYGRENRVEFNFGAGKEFVLDMTECTFEAFLRSFAEILGRIQAYCDNLLPVPPMSEKRFRTSFCKKLPENIETGSFSINTQPFEYAQNIKLKDIGKAALHEVALGAVLRTCYLPENEEFVNEQISEAIRSKVDNIFEGAREQEQQVPPQHEHAEEHPLHSTRGPGAPMPFVLDESAIPGLDHTLAEEQQQEEHAFENQSPARSVTSLEAVLSPFGRHRNLSFN